MRIALLCVSLSLGVPVLATVQNPHDYLPDTVENHWAYETIGYLKRMGFVKREEKRIIGPNPYSRMDMAIMIKAGCDRMRKSWLEMRDANDRIAGIGKFGSGKLSAAEITRGELSDRTFQIGSLCREVERPLAATIKLFAPQLRQLNTDPTVMGTEALRNLEAIASLRVAQPGEAKQLFADVPANHWAADALKNLREEGILRGYADGSFGE